MSAHRAQSERPILTASLTTEVARVAYGIQQCEALIDEILQLDHVEWETTLMVGDVQFHQTKSGPFPDHQMRVSVRPSAGCAALSYTDNNDPDMVIANSHNPEWWPADVDLIFNGTTGAMFPHSAIISIADARRALVEWLRTHQRPTCIEWAPYDSY